jgi:hypothetical protein
MKRGVVLYVVVAALVVGACGGNGDVGAPLTLEQRVPGDADAPGSAPDPEEERRTAVGPDELVAILEDVLFTPTEEEAATIREAGSVSAILDTRYIPAEVGGEHGSHLPHVLTLVAQFDSAAGAIEMVDLLKADALEPCPDTCAFDFAEFDVEGIPAGRGVQRIATQERLEQVGDDRPPVAEYMVLFADGPFAYSLSLFGPPGEVSERQATEIATNLYDRVHGSPPPPPA